MILNIIEYVNDTILLINSICHVTIFLGGFYVALHSRVLPTWTVTGIWYIGVSSFLALLPIVFEWLNGPSFEFSYTMLGRVTDTFLHINVAIMVILLFLNTIYKDFKSVKNRKNDANIMNQF